MTNERNVVTSKDVTPVKKTPVKKVVKKEQVITESKNDKILICYQSGAGYVLPNGLKFSEGNRLAEVPSGEAQALLRLDNFRLPSDEEKNVYYNSQED